MSGFYVRNFRWNYRWDGQRVILRFDGVLDGRICITENLSVAGYGGKASGPESLKSPKDIDMKGSFTIYAAELDAPPPDVVPDLTFTSHYGF